MNVVNKNNGERYKVYDIKYNKAGYPHFLIYKEGQWFCMSAKYFRPYSSEDIKKDEDIKEDLEKAFKNTNSLIFSKPL